MEAQENDNCGGEMMYSSTRSRHEYEEKNPDAPAANKEKAEKEEWVCKHTLQNMFASVFKRVTEIECYMLYI